jgi:hypothetical protein
MNSNQEDSIENILQDLILAIESMQAGSKFDLTDSPKSFIANVNRFVQEARERRSFLPRKD